MRKPIPRISTRGYYDLKTGKTIKKNKYFLYPKKSFEKLYGVKDMTIMIHGLRNDKAGAVNKFEIAKKRLKVIGYKFPVIGFSYDANTYGANLKKYELKALRAGEKIAQKNGKNLAKFILDFKNKSPETKIRLIGHSLGTTVIQSTICHLAKIVDGSILESVYFFGSSIPIDTLSSKKYVKLFQKIIKTKLVNYYSPNDEVLQYAAHQGQIKNPLGLKGIKKKSFPKYIQKKVNPRNHRFVSYSSILTKFP